MGNFCIANHDTGMAIFFGTQSQWWNLTWAYPPAEPPVYTLAC